VEHEADSALRRIGRYEVLGELGQGGMAVVYRAHDPQLERDVAIKVLHPHLARDEESRARFAREARAAARLRHPNIVEVYEFSEAQDTRSYLVTELLEGPTLRRFVEQHPDVPAEVAAAMGIVLCDALACAHRQGVIHRDVKPDNLMLQGGALKLTDFGIAHVVDAREMTATGQVLGSPAHMAPEQIEGSRVDARTDVFATGTVLYALTAGRLPFDGANAHALLRKILDGEFTDPLRVAPKMGHRFAAILRRAMARIPADRYESAEALRDALVEFVAEVGWTAPEVELRRYFSDPEGFTAALRTTLLAVLPRRGESARAAGDLPEAMGYFNRALALDPSNTRVLALLRSAARRRQMLRRLRAAGLVGAAAAVTAVCVLGAVALLHPAPTPGVVVVPPETAVRREAIAPRVRVVETARPPVVAEVDASMPGAGTEPTQRVHGHSARNGGQTGPSGAAAGAPEAAAAMREVRLVPFPQNVRYSVNGAPTVVFSSHAEPLRLPVGRAATFVVEHSLPGAGYERAEVTQMIEAGDGVQVVRVRLRERATVEPAAAMVDGASPR
jgi:tetratricopeptide (TPR) repeat protein